MVAEVIAGLGAIKSAFDIAKGLKDIDDATRRNAAVIELQEKILSAQAAQSELVDTVRQLKARVTELETWEAEKQRYELKEVGRGTFAYVIKKDMRGGEPPHQICAYCYQKGHKRILQLHTRGVHTELICSDCKTVLRITPDGTASVIVSHPTHNPFGGYER